MILAGYQGPWALIVYTTNLTQYADTTVHLLYNPCCLRSEGLKPVKWLVGPFLTLLDSVSRPHGMGLQHVAIHRLHSQSLSQLSHNLLNAFLSNFSSSCPGPEAGWK